jgi:cbb3-type cytochrome oxidase subunit 3
MVVVGVVLAVVFAGVGVIVVGALGVAALAVVAAIAPLFLPLLLLAAIWYLVSRSRKNRALRAHAA